MDFHKKLGLFFDDRALLFLNKKRLTRRDLCYIAGRDYRIWTDEVYEDQINDFQGTLDFSVDSKLLEVGCAAGFLAQGLSPRVKEYYGVDLSPACLVVSRRLSLPNAHFKRANGIALPWADSFFDFALCADVFSNISDMDICKKIIVEMLRVVRVGGGILISSLPDASCKDEYLRRVSEVSKSLPPLVEDPDIVAQTWAPWYYGLMQKIRHQLGNNFIPEAINYYHEKKFYVDLGNELGVESKILPVHSLNPYHGFRFNVLYVKG